MTNTWYEVEKQESVGVWIPVMDTRPHRSTTGSIRRWHDPEEAGMYAMQYSSLAYPMRVLQKELTTTVLERQRVS